MTAVELVAARRRNAEATRAAILDAARGRFACEGYDRAGLREIAADAGVDAALVSRYFGGKDELFAAVLASTANAEELFHGTRREFAERMARMMVREPQSDTKMDCILIMLRSASSERAAEANRRFGDIHFFEPMAEWIGGELSARQIELAFDTGFGPGAGRRVAMTCERDGGRRLVVELQLSLAGAITPASALGDLLAAAPEMGRDCATGTVDPAGRDR